MKVGKDLGAQAPDGTLGQIIRDSDLPAELKDANLGFFLEALTPAFASFWAIAHVLTDKTGGRKSSAWLELSNTSDSTRLYWTRLNLPLLPEGGARHHSKYRRLQVKSKHGRKLR